MRLFSYIFLFLLTTWQLIAQTYPVQVVPVLTPPYSSKIADYANPMANKVQLQLITTDLSVQNRPVQLYVEIKGNGLTAASAPVLSGVSPLRISGGEILRLTNAELASYFQLRNLQGITSQQYASALPDGMYSFCFRVKDVLSGRWLSQSHCAIAYLMLNDPPILNIPSDNEQVAVTDFQNIIFSWTPRQINATNVTYSFELREILDPTLDPRFAFEVSRRILKEDDLRMTTFVYDVSKPNLIPSRRYAWRVRAISTGGLAENSVFKNDGYSEVHTFVYAVNCSKPLFLLSEQQGKSRTKLLWQGHTLHQKYHIQYRKKNVEGAQWFETFTRNTQTLIANLEAGEYEFRVGASCEGERYGITPSYVYSDIQTFKIEKTPNTTEQGYNCGIVPKITITNQKPLNSLVTNEVFTAGDFAVTLLEVSGSNGVFSGKGFIKVPYLNDTKLAVEFENVKINSDYQLTDGVVKTTYDADWKNVQFIENLIGQGKKSKDIEVPFEIDKVETRNGEIVVTGKDGRKEVFPFGGNDSTVKGKVTTTTNGVTSTQEKIYHIDKDGKVSEPQTVAQGGKPTKENTNGVSKGGEATALTAKGIEVTFENTADSKYAYEVPTKAYSKDYQKLDGKYIPFKAVVKGETEPFLAKVQITDKNISADSLIFKTDKGALIESKRVEGSNDFLLTLKGFHSFAVEQVQATIKQGKKYQIAGVFNLVHLSPKTAKVILVPTVENISMDIDRVKSIYSKIGVTLDITWAAPFDITPYLTNGSLETNDVFGDLTDYSPSQQAIINAYKATGKVANDTYYVFITNAKSSTGQGGYMALGGQFGFVFDQTERTLAHELGHGIFKLAHPFKKKQQGNVPSLMDYTSDEALLFADWKQINDPAFKIGIFQGQSEGEYKAWKFLIGSTVEQIPGYENKEKSFISPTSSVITLPAKARDFSFVKGTLIGFTIADERWIALFSKNDSIFKGYYKDAQQDKNENFEIVGKNYFTYKQNKNLIQEIFYVSPSQCNEVNIYKGKISKEAFFSENGGVGSAYFSNIVFDNIKGLSNWELLSTASDPLNCLKKTQREFYKFIIEHYREHNVQISETDKETLRNILSKFADVRISSLDAPPAYAIQVKYDEMLKTGIKELIYDLQTNIEKEIGKNEELLKNTSLLIVLDDFKRIHDKYLFYEHLIEIVDKDCVFGEKFRELRDKDGKMKPFLEVAKLIIDGTYEILSLNELLENTTCTLKMLRIPPNVWNSDRIDYKTAESFKEFLEKLGFDTNNVILSSLLNAQFELGAPCSCGMWNSTVDLVVGISDLAAGISQKPTDLVKGINNFISALFQSDTWEAMGDALKKHHGVYNTSVKTPQAVYGACYDAIFVASFFVGAGEIKALSEASSFADVMRVVGKVGSNGKAFVVSLSKIPNVATQKAALFLADHCTEVLRFLPKEGKIYIYSKLIDAELARFTAQGIELLPQAGKIEQVLFETTEEITDVNGKTGKLIVGKDAQGKIVLEIAGEATNINKLQQFLSNNDKVVALIKKLNSKFNKVDDFAKRFEELYQKVPKNSVKAIDDLMDDLKHLFTEHIDEIPEGQLVAFLNELLETGDKFKAGATSLEVIRNIKSYLPAKFHSTLQKLELEDLISYADEAGDFRFDIKWKASNSEGFPISIFIDTKNYSTARNMFKNLGQYKAYLEVIDDFEQLYIIQQGGRGVTRKEVIERLESAIAKDAKSVFDAKKSLWRNMGIRSFKELEDFAKTKELSTSTKYRAFQESIKVTF